MKRSERANKARFILNHDTMSIPDVYKDTKRLIVVRIGLLNLPSARFGIYRFQIYNIEDFFVIDVVSWTLVPWWFLDCHVNEELKAIVENKFKAKIGL